MAHDDSLSERLAFMRLDEAERRALAAAGPAVRKGLRPSLEAFYAQVRQYPAVARLFRDEGHIAGAQSAQEKHWSHIVSGTFDEQYAEGARRIGGVHARIGLEPRWYIGGYAMILTGLVRSILDEDAASAKGWGRRKGRAGETADRISAVIKAALLDMDLVIDLYLGAAETARREADAQRAEVQKQQTEVVRTTAEGLSALAGGDLTYRIDQAFPGDYEPLRVDFNAAMQTLQDAMHVIGANAGTMTASSREISDAADDLSRRTEQQAATLEETSAALEEITVTVRRAAEAADEAHRAVGAARQESEHSGVVMAEAVQAMDGIARSSREIGQIIGVIDEIAFQTNLLALNAGVEAARAGEAGRGFAVVASEVRALAQRSAEAAKEIKALISASSTQVERGVGLVGDTGRALERISGQVQAISGLMAEIAASAQQQSTGLGEVNTAVGQMDQMTQQNAAMVEESTAASHNLAREAGELAALIGRFRLEREPRAAARPAPAPAARRIPRIVGGTALKDDWTEF